ncbi:MAG: hypothetical protein AAGJ35_05750, partial [Myxococcota bacterium]
MSTPSSPSFFQSLWSKRSNPKRRKRTRLPRELSFTTEGKWFVAMTIGLGIAAINTGNNLLYLILGMMLSFIVISGLLSNLVLRNIHIERQFPSQIKAQHPMLLTWILHNHKRSASSYSIELEEQPQPLRPYQPLRSTQQGYVLKVPPQQQQSATTRCTFPKHGTYRFETIKVSTRFPFSLFVKTRRIHHIQDCIVWPSPRPLPNQLLQASHHFGTQNNNTQGQGIDFLSLREMRPEDE